MFISRTHATIHGSTVHTSPSVTHTHTMLSPSDTGALSGHSFNGTPINTYAFVPLTSGHALPSHTNERAHIERQSTAADRPARVRNNIAPASHTPRHPLASRCTRHQPSCIRSTDPRSRPSPSSPIISGAKHTVAQYILYARIHTIRCAGACAAHTANCTDAALPTGTDHLQSPAQLCSSSTRRALPGRADVSVSHNTRAFHVHLRTSRFHRPAMSRRIRRDASND